MHYAFLEPVVYFWNILSDTAGLNSLNEDSITHKKVSCSRCYAMKATSKLERTISFSIKFQLS